MLEVLIPSTPSTQYTSFIHLYSPALVCPVASRLVIQYRVPYNIYLELSCEPYELVQFFPRTPFRAPRPLLVKLA